MSDSQVTVTAEVFAQKLKQQYPQHASALGDRLMDAFVKDHPQYQVTYEGGKAVSVSWRRTCASAKTTSFTPTTVSGPAPDSKIFATQPEQQLAHEVQSSESYSGQAQEHASEYDDSGVRPQVPAINRRKQPRVPCRKTKAYVITDGVPGVVVDVVDISRGGACFLSFEQFRPYTAVSIATHYIEGGQNIFQVGLIVRVRHKQSALLPTEYAVEFSFK